MNVIALKQGSPLFFSLIFFVGISALFPADWPQFRGPQRNGKSAETGLLTSWPDGGPKRLWINTELGKGFSSASVANGIIYITGMEGKQEFLYALDLQGKILWKSGVGDVWSKSFSDPRCTPTVDNGRVYVISGLGRLGCFDAASGKEIWVRDFFTEFEGEYHRWGIAESPLIEGDLVFCTPGGKKATMIALNKTNGALVWASESLGDKPTYCSPVLMRQGSTPVIINMLENHVAGFDANQGRVLWKIPYSTFHKKHNAINPNTPLVRGNMFYTTSGYDNGSDMFRLNEKGEAVLVWQDSVLDVHHGNVVEVNGCIYGSNWLNNSRGNWVCLNWDLGQVEYETTWENKGSVITAEGMLYCYDESDGNLALVKASPKAFEPVSSFQMKEGSGPYWAHPSISDGILYLRHGEALSAYVISK
ncbi:PQQ-binding-like beta-propeller repeat protein [bacterium]|nr:PQQ-binding-like beta-propeller repeat protein [bacterium]